MSISHYLKIPFHSFIDRNRVLDHKDNVPIKEITYLLHWGETQNGFEIVTFIDIDLLRRLTLYNIHNQLLSTSEFFL